MSVVYNAQGFWEVNNSEGSDGPMVRAEVMRAIEGVPEKVPIGGLKLLEHCRDILGVLTCRLMLYGVN